ncbi:hypothetical protein CMK11_11150 [Candidatus Poribacteria bacterium]|nr:hypothetical protein [Candidatus Poribacteria bacterium]
MAEEAISKPIHDVQVDRHVSVPMRDGTILRADVYRPTAEGQYPVVLERVAYELIDRCTVNGEFFAQHGYVFVGQSVRGRFGSGGRFEPMRDDAWGANQDGYDSVEWAGAQPWSDGNVGMADGSYSGLTQYLVAPTRPPHLKALFARQADTGWYGGHNYRGGAHDLGRRREWALKQTLIQLEHETAPPGTEEARERLSKAVDEIETWYWHLPLKSCPPLEGLADWYFDILEHPEDGPYWQPVDIVPMFAEIDVPIYHLGGWFDMFVKGTLRAFQGIREQGRTAACRQAQRVTIGPWVHGQSNIGRQRTSELDFGPAAAFDQREHWLRWYDYWLKGVDTGIMELPPVRVFLMGANRWLDLTVWPPPDVTYQPIYFREGTGQTEASLNSGGLTFAAPAAAEQPDSFVYDPADPVRSLIKGQELWPTDHRPVEGQMLTYTSDVLERDVTVVGPVKAILHALSSAPDTDWVVRLCDVWPDGRSMSVCDGILRSRYRNSLARAELMTPGQLYQLEVELTPTAQVFQTGHRMRVEVTSSDFPRADRNLNTGGPFGEEVQGQAAVNTIFHDAMRPSQLVLPIS